MADVYCMNIDEVDNDFIWKLRWFISEKRIRKADKLRKKRDYISCILSEAMVRSYYVERFHIKNEDIVFDRNKWGRPFVKLENVSQFSVSHAGNWVVCAYDEDRIGVDVEVVRSASAEGIKNQFHPIEQKKIFDSQNDKLFTAIWTLKESYTKYCGMGLYLPMNEFYVCKDSFDLWKIPQNSGVILKQCDLENDIIMSVCYGVGKDVRFHMMKQEDLLKILQIRMTEC